MPSRALLSLAALVLGIAISCGGSSSPGSSSSDVITISNYTYSPANLTVAAGATVTVHNEDSVQHSVTSQAMPNAFTPGAVAGIQFDTKPFSGTTTFTIPSTAVSGTVIPYFCTVHGSMMGTGTITIK